jgi:hypothetical protein
VVLAAVLLFVAQPVNAFLESEILRVENFELSLDLHEQLVETNPQGRGQR